MRVLGLDPGSRRTGYGVVERRGSAHQALAHGVATASARLDLAHRLHTIVHQVGEVMDAWRPDAVAVEEAFYHESVRSTLVLGHVRGALLVAAVERDFTVAEYTPREIKMSVAGNGGATKDQVEFMVRRLLAIRGALAADASDALAVALCHLHRAGSASRARALGAATRGLEALLERQRRSSK